ncbi:MAG: hypothetical protein HC867_00010 [Bacteroidia bacterium]|nr:hypothetical protein [Bacteroidia bacterium]
MDTDLFFEVFSKSEFHQKWDKHIEYASRCSYATPDYRLDWVQALGFARQELGEFFLKVCGKNHPLLNILVSKGDWQTDELISITKLLGRLKAADSEYEKLRLKLIPETDCMTEGKPFLDVLQMLYSAGFNGKLVKESKFEKSPDIEFVNMDNKEKLFAEVSKLREGDDRELINDNYWRFFNLMESQGNYLPYSLAQLRSLDSIEMEKCLEITRNCRDKAMKEETIIFHHDEMIRLAISHIDKYEELMKWIEKNDYRKGLLGAPLNFDDTYRLSNNKMNKEAKQLPKDSPGLVYIPVNPIYFMVFNLEEAIKLFAIRMRKYPNLYGTVVYSTILDGVESEPLYIDGHFYGIQKPNKAVSKCLFLQKSTF